MSAKPTPMQRKPQSYRLPQDCLEIIKDAKDEAAANGDRLTSDMIVTEAIRMWRKAQARKRQK